MDLPSSEKITKTYRSIVPDDGRTYSFVKVFRHPDAPAVSKPLENSNHHPIDLLIHLVPDLQPVFAGNMPLNHFLGVIQLSAWEMGQAINLATRNQMNVMMADDAKLPYLHSAHVLSATFYLGKEPLESTAFRPIEDKSGSMDSFGREFMPFSLRELRDCEPVGKLIDAYDAPLHPAHSMVTA